MSLLSAQVVLWAGEADESIKMFGPSVHVLRHKTGVISLLAHGHHIKETIHTYLHNTPCLIEMRDPSQKISNCTHPHNIISIFSVFHHTLQLLHS